MHLIQRFLCDRSKRFCFPKLVIYQNISCRELLKKPIQIFFLTIVNVWCKRGFLQIIWIDFWSEPVTWILICFCKKRLSRFNLLLFIKKLPKCSEKNSHANPITFLNLSMYGEPWNFEIFCDKQNLKWNIWHS